MQIQTTHQMLQQMTQENTAMFSTNIQCSVTASDILARIRRLYCRL